MSLSDCVHCWETPCICGYEYRKMNWEDRINLALTVLGCDDEIPRIVLEDCIESLYPTITELLKTITPIEYPKKNWNE